MTIATETLVLSSNTILLRKFRDSDLEDLSKVTSDPEAMGSMGGIMSPEQSRAYLRKLIEQDQKVHSMYAVIHRPTMEFAGIAGFSESALEFPEICVAIIPRFRRKGLAKEALDLCLNYANDVLGKNIVATLIKSENKVGKKIVRKIRFKFKKFTFKNGKSFEMYVYTS
jgi:RimJ/RimL family protein N-acetyltransferase